MDEMEEDISGFVPLYATAQVLGVLSVILTAVWTLGFRGGLAWSSDPAHQFNWHPLLMVLGMVYLYGNGVLMYRAAALPFCRPNREVRGMMAYRAFRNERKRRLKLAHAGANLASLVLASVGLRAVFAFHNASSIPNMYSLHSWLGIATVVLFALQWVFGLVTFLFPGLSSPLRAWALTYHVFLGAAIFVCACATSLMGITEKAIFAIKKNPDGSGSAYSDKTSEGSLVNCIGITIIAFAAVVMYLVTNSRFKRQPRPEENTLLEEETQDERE